MIKIIAGKHKRKNINTPHSMKTRPTSLKLRESVFNILLHSKYLDNKIENMEVIDLFAGSGALGLESLSRGFKFCTFVDNSIESINIIKNNIKILNEEDNTDLIQGDATTPFLTNKKYDICFLDPPYELKDISILINKWASSGAMKDNTLYIYEKHKNTPFNSVNDMNIIEKRQYGSSEVIILKKLSSSTK